MSNVLVTGAGGYIGSVLTLMLLDHGHRVVAVDRFLFGRDTLPQEGNGLKVIEADIRTMDESVFEGINAVIDLAALSNDPSGELEPQKTMEVNHLGRVRVARLAKKLGAERYILPSSCSIYGYQGGVLDEESPVSPLTTYAKANLRAEEDVLPLADQGFCVVVIRQSTVYGVSKRMRFDLAINGMVKGFYQTGKIPILRDGTQWRPFVHVTDTARVMIDLLDAPAEVISGQVINVGSDDQNVQLLELARMVADIMQVKFKYEWYGSPDNRSYRVSFRKLRNLVGFEPKCTPADGAAEVYEALGQGVVDPYDPRTITVEWYKHLILQGESL